MNELKESPPNGGDEIHVGDITRSKGIAIGPGARAVVVEGNVIISIGDKQVVIPRIAQIAIAVVTIGVIFLVLAQTANLLATFAPARMEGDFNIAVAQFQVVGQGDGLDDAQELAQSIANAIDRQMQKLAGEIEQHIEVCPPQETGKIKGETEEERAESAHALAKGINADVVVYGIVEVTGLAATIRPEFYVRSDDFDAAAEVTGQYRMGSPISIDKVDNITRKSEVGDTLADRSRALAFIIYGLADFVIGQNEAAEANFNEALSIEAWDNPDVVYVLLGNAALRQRDPKRAETYYRQALDANPDYARAHAGLGAVFYHQALGDLQSDTYATIDTKLLDQSIQEYQHASDPSLEHSPLADTPLKADFDLGRVYLSKALVEAEKGNDSESKRNLALAIESFEGVIHAYQSYAGRDKARIKELTAHAHGQLGLVYRLTNQFEVAIHEYEEALELMPLLDRTKEHRALYEANLGDLYDKVGNRSKAIEWYERAVEHAPTGSDEKSKYQERLDELR